MSGPDHARVLRFESKNREANWLDLTPREKEICILLVIHNMSYDSIASELKISRSTVAFHIATAMRILRVTNTRRLAFWMGVHSEKFLHNST